MIQHPAVQKILNVLEDLRIGYMLSGSVATTYYGEPRLTHDVDIVIDVDLKTAMQLLAPLSTEYYISEDGIRDAVANETMFNAIHDESGLKIDFWILTESDFDRSRFERRIAHSVGGQQCYFTSPEDTIVIKLKWIRESGHAKHVDDVKNMIKVLQGNLDYGYIGLWVQKLGLREEAEITGLKIR